MDNLSREQRQQRNSIRNGYMCENVATIQAAIDITGRSAYSPFGKKCLQEMIDECKAGGVDNYGKLPAF